jgi:hypothetical protein
VTVVVVRTVEDGVQEWMEVNNHGQGLLCFVRAVHALGSRLSGVAACVEGGLSGDSLCLTVQLTDRTRRRVPRTDSRITALAKKMMSASKGAPFQSTPCNKLNVTGGRRQSPSMSLRST